MNKNKKVIIGLSGGVDSAYSAYLLKKQGYDVEAFFMQNWDKVKNKEFNNLMFDQDGDDVCQQTIDLEDAKEVARFLDIPFHYVNLVDEYWNFVFKQFLDELKQGITPNPDILCNRYIKFNKFIEKIKEEIGEFDYIATGHYASIIDKNGKKYLARAKDETKDQTYFLAEIDKSILSKIIFPLQDISKSEIREKALQLNLPVAKKKDSTGICFIGERNFAKFISNYLEVKEGDIKEIESNKTIGKHGGAILYTIGQRRGLNLGGQKEPMFVVKKDIENNIVYVGNENNELLFTKTIKARNFKLLVDIEDFSFEGMDVEIKVRHSIESHQAKILSFDQNSLYMVVLLKEKIKAVTAGQELVIYFNEIVIGGGQIVD